MLLWSPIPTWYDRRLYRPAAKLAHHFTLLHTAQKIGFFLGALRSYLIPQSLFLVCTCIPCPRSDFQRRERGTVLSLRKVTVPRPTDRDFVPLIALHRYWCKPWIAAAHDKVLQVSPSSSQVLLIHRDWLSWDPLCLFVCYGFVVPLERIFSTYLETSSLPMKSCKIWRMLGIHGHWVVMDL